jgi:hypothetical protein
MSDVKVVLADIANSPKYLQHEWRVGCEEDEVRVCQ